MFQKINFLFLILLVSGACFGSEPLSSSNENEYEKRSNVDLRDVLLDQNTIGKQPISASGFRLSESTIQNLRSDKPTQLNFFRIFSHGEFSVESTQFHYHFYFEYIPVICRFKLFETFLI